MKIGVVSVLYPSTRNPTSGIFVKEELDSLSRNVEIKLIAPLPNQHWFRESRIKTANTVYPVVRPFTIAFPRWFMQKYYPSSMAFTLRRVGTEFFDGCDIVHAHFAFPEGVAVVKAFAERFPILITVHGGDINYFAMKPDLKPDIVQALNAAKRIICVSKSLVKTLKGLGVTSETVVIPNGIYTTHLTPGSKINASELLGLEPRRPRILYAGNFVVVKGVEYLIQAMTEVLKVIPDCELVLLGARPGKVDRSRYKRYIESSGVEHAVKIVERVPHDELPHWIHASDLLALPSIREGFGLVAVEALACGRPVVSTRSGGPEDIVVKGTGLLVPPKNPEALSEALLKVLGGDGILSPESLAESARSRFLYEIVTDKIVNVYKDICSENRFEV